jgi:hypothetical protein
MEGQTGLCGFLPIAQVLARALGLRFVYALLFRRWASDYLDEVAGARSWRAKAALTSSALSSK